MIELGLFHNGSGDLPIKVTEDGIHLIEGNLADIHEQAKRALVEMARQGVLAERLGLDYYWISEHHFVIEGSEFSPNPLLVEAAIASQTNKIRLGQASNIVPWHDPIRLAENVAMLDVLSGGRVECSIGRGYQNRETEVLGRHVGSSNQDQERNRAFFEEAYEILIKAWTEPSFSHQGTFESIPPSYTSWPVRSTRAFFGEPGTERSVEDVLDLTTNPSQPMLRELSVLPQPLQRPYPPMWATVGTERSVRWAARNGLNAHLLALPTEVLKKTVAWYYDEAEKCGWPDPLDRGEFKFGWDAEHHRGVSVQKYLHIVDSSRGLGDKEKYGKGVCLLWDFISSFGFAAALPPRPGEESRNPTDQPTAQELFDSGIAMVGTPEEIIESILEIKNETGFVNDFMFTCELAFAAMAPAEVEEQMHCYAEEIAPVLRRECGGQPDHPVSTIDWDVSPRSVPA